MNEFAEKLLGLLRGESVDLSEPRLLEALERLDRFGELGRMTAAFAHDLRTPLHVAASAAEAILEAHPEDAALRKEVELIVRTCAHAEDSLQALLDFTKGGPVPAEDLASIGARALALVEARCSKQEVKVRTRWGKGRLVPADARRMVAVVANLLSNALDAMPSGGRLTVRTGEAWLTVRDSGGGMDAEELKRAGGPFYTTKKEGTGLGLFLSKRLLAAHGAALTFRSKKGGGTVVKLVFPT